ncbi:MAG: 1-acyl-sn-glycerol-3-phosphate acyltransferase [Spirochaetales bacterium]|nr:1-acyl-sn-glycerol-3-phosphate acyltransferase [Spirochaetales bacterium]
MMFVYKKIRQVYHVIAKFYAFFWFGIGSLILANILFPVINIFIQHGDRLSHIKRSIIRFSFSIFVYLMRFLRLISLKVDNVTIIKNFRHMIICANHPSLIDVVILMSLVPQADCIVKAKLWNNIFIKGVVRSVYIPNSLNAEDTIKACDRSLRKGNNLIIFPEGTRTMDSQNIRLQRSAAQISLRTGFSILPIQISAGSPKGLAKGDSAFSSPDSGIVRYHLKIKSLLEPKKYTDLSIAKASRLLTQDLKKAIING